MAYSKKRLPAVLTVIDGHTAESMLQVILPSTTPATQPTFMFIFHNNLIAQSSMSGCMSVLQIA